MVLEKYKICPACGEHNAPNLLECRKCETDLTGIKIVDATAVQAASATPRLAKSLGDNGFFNR